MITRIKNGLLIRSGSCGHSKKEKHGNRILLMRNAIGRPAGVKIEYVIGEPVDEEVLFDVINHIMEKGENKFKQELARDVEVLLHVINFSGVLMRVYYRVMPPQKRSPP